MKISVVLPTLQRPSLKKCLDSLKDADEIILVTDTDKTVVECYNKGYKQASGDVIFHTNDRLYYDAGWRGKVETALEKLDNYGLVSFFELICISGCLTRDYIEKEQGGYLYWPEYFHYWGDREMSDRAGNLGHYSKIDGVAHWIDVKRNIVNDEKKNRQAAWDKKVYDLRSTLGFPLRFVSSIKEYENLSK